MATGNLKGILRVLNVADTLASSPGVPPVKVKAITYMIGQFGPFTDQFTTANYTPENIQAAIQKNLDGINAAGGVPVAQGA